MYQAITIASGIGAIACFSLVTERKKNVHQIPSAD
jgi:hypothetical protein